MTSPVLNRAGRRRRRLATSLVSAGAAAALLAGTAISPAAADVPAGPVGTTGCFAGDRTVVDIVYPGTTDVVKANCSKSEPSPLAAVGDALLGLIAPNLGLSLQGLNGAGAFGMGDAKIKGNGLTSAITLMGVADATADDYLSAALALAFAQGSTAVSNATFGSVATAFSFGGAADARSLPAGIAFAVNIGADTAKSSATALGGFAAALNIADDGSWGPGGGKAICTALYGSASITDGGENVSSCTSVLFLFQQYQVGDGPVVYAIKNPFDLRLHSVLTEEASEIFGFLGGAMGMPPALIDLLGIKMIPEFGSDLIRIEMGPDGPKLGTGLGDWFSHLTDKGTPADPSSGDEVVTAAKSSSDLDDLAAPAATPKAASSTLDDLGAPSSAPAPQTPTLNDGPSEAGLSTEPAAPAPAAEAPSAPATEAPVADEPAAEGPSGDLDLS